MKLTYQHSIKEQRKFGAEKVNQTMFINVKYDAAHDCVDDVEVWIHENGNPKGIEISKLLDKAEGNPLATMLEAIDWRELADNYGEQDGNYMDEDTRGMVASAQTIVNNYPELSIAGR